MAIPIILKIDVKKINKEWLFTGSKGTYLDAVLYENDRESAYGDTHVVKQSPPKEARDKGEKPIIIGNGKPMPQKRGQRTAPSQHGAVRAADHHLMQDKDDSGIPW